MTKGLKRIFSKVYEDYEFVNHLVTLGQDIWWRRRTVNRISRSNRSVMLDMCTGTGEMAVLINSLARDGDQVVAVDFSGPMIMAAKRKEASKGVEFALANASTLPFRDRVFDVILLSFAARNLASSPLGLSTFLKEFYRILKKGGILLIAETSQPPYPILRRMFHSYMENVTSKVGYLLTGERSAYRYLAKSVRRFYGAEELRILLLGAGFKDVLFRRMSFGMAAIHEARR